jgi:quercetin dioxygenase-like cupin family protein
MKRTVLAAALLGAGVAVGITVDRTAFAQQQSQQPSIKRTILLRTDDAGNKNYEAIMAIAEIPAGAASGKHLHHGVEVAYVLEGTVSVDHDGKPAQVVKAGEAMSNDNAVAHNAHNIGKTPVKILTVYVVEKGKPLADPVP